MKILNIYPFPVFPYLAGITGTGCLPEAAPLKKYSYRANRSMIPDDYVAGLPVVHYPMFVLIGGIRHNTQSFIFVKDGVSIL